MMNSNVKVEKKMLRLSTFSKSYKKFNG